MAGKLRHIKTLYKNKSEFNKTTRQILYDDRLKKILEKYGKSALTPILPRDFFKCLNGYDINSPVEIFTDFMNGCSPVNDYLFLIHTAKALKIKNYFEIGTWVGLSAYNIAANTGKDTNIYTLDLPFDHPEINAFNIPVEIFGYHSRGIKNVTHLKADSCEFDFSPYKGKMDLVFIDGNHAVNYVANDSQRALELLKNEKSVILWHDYLIEGNINNNVLCGILEKIPENEHRHLYYLYQSNMAVFSRAINFTPGTIAKWEIPEYKFHIKITPGKK